MTSTSSPNKSGATKQVMCLMFLVTLGAALYTFIATRVEGSFLPGTQGAKRVASEPSANPTTASPTTASPTTCSPTTGSPSASPTKAPTGSPTTASLLSPEVTDANVTIGGKSYSLELLDQDGTPRDFPNDPQAAKAAAELQAALPLPTPILVVGMPKAGTSSIYEFFQQSGAHRTVHWNWYRPGHKIPKLRIGICMKNAFEKGQPLLKTCGGFDVWAQIDTSEPDTVGCYFPQITNLLEIHQEAPSATFILNRRNYTQWASSVGRWSPATMGLGLDKRLAYCKPFGPKSSSAKDLIQWHQEQVQRVRQFVLDHPSHALLEVDIQDGSTGERMSKSFQIDAKHWGQANHNIKNKTQNDAS